MRKIGVFGGTFNPIHYGHLRSALEVLSEFSLERILFIPCHIPPHRALPLVCANDRAEMIRLAIAPMPAFQLDTLELEREGPSYSVPTLLALKKRYAEPTALYFILGEDAFSHMHTWFEWQKIPTLCHLIVLSRPKKEPLHNQTPPVIQSAFATPEYGEIFYPSVTSLDISSSLIRGLFHTGKPASFLLPSTVEDYILSKHFYKEPML